MRVYESVMVSVSECRQRMCEAGLPKIIKIKQQTKGKRGLPAKPKTSKYKQVHEWEKYGWRGREGVEEGKARMWKRKEQKETGRRASEIDKDLDVT